MLGLPEEFTPDFLARLEHLRIKTRREFEGLGKGTHLSPRRGSSLEFSDFRHYALGDDFRFIDWGLYGRTDKLYIKLFKEEEDLLTYIFLDASASMGLPEADPKVPSVTALYPTADWHEREVYDFFGVIFQGHPDLRRIELPDEWTTFPLRKDHPLAGVATRYHDGRFIPPPDERGT